MSSDFSPFNLVHCWRFWLINWFIELVFKCLFSVRFFSKTLFDLFLFCINIISVNCLFTCSQILLNFLIIILLNCLSYIFPVLIFWNPFPENYCVLLVELYYLIFSYSQSFALKFVHLIDWASLPLFWGSLRGRFLLKMYLGYWFIITFLFCFWPSTTVAYL